MPPWLTVHTRKVLSAFVGTLARSGKWETIFIVSPWLSGFGKDCGMTFEQLVKWVRDERPTLYLVTRPPTEDWHRDAVQLLVETKTANVALVPSLHAKLFVAETQTLSFCMLTSANFTVQSLVNQEIGLMVRDKAGGQPLFRRLRQEAALSLGAGHRCRTETG
jgi:hypothetical protein